MSGRVQRIAGHRRTTLDTGWELCEGAASGAAWQRIESPGTVAHVLRRAGQWSLDGPARDFDAAAWTFRAEFDVLDAEADRHVLGLDGLATVAEVVLNDVPLLRSDNMFLSHEIDVGHLLRPRSNHLMLRFASLGEELARRRPRPRWRVPMLQQQQQLRWWRTTLLGRTPGWSPPAAAVGPWRGVWLESRRAIDVSGLQLRALAHDSDGRLELSCRVAQLGRAAVVRVQAVVARDGREVAGLLQRQGETYAGHVVVPDIARWWPHTHGEPCLYALALLVWLEGEAQPIEIGAGSVGFRTLKWRTEGDDFELSVNGEPIFCRGACWTPIDPVSLHGPPAAYGPAIAQVREAGMNMLRLGGTMVYEADEFYDACDAQGVLVWQDLMFANMDYPADRAFIDGVRREVTQQIERWQGRPAMALLCGNSEAEQQAAMWGAPRSQWEQELFSAELPGLVTELAPDVPYWPSSAHGGAFPFQADAGTASYYGVGAYLRPLHDANQSDVRFASECLAFANIPEPSTLARLGTGATKVHQAMWKARSPRDLGAGWDFDDVRDHYLHTLFGIDVAALRYSDHERYLMLGRAVTGVAMAEAFAQWRAVGSSCRGALVWFWRDLWAGAGWGLLDDAGQPKACWWMLRRTLQPVCLAIADSGVNGLRLNVVNESAQVIDARLRLAAYRDGETQLLHGESSVTLAPRSRQAIPAVALLEEFADLSYAYRFGPRAHDMVAAELHDGQGLLLAQAVHWFDHSTLRAGVDLGLMATAREIAEGLGELTVTTRRAARGVHVDIPGWRAQDSYFDLLPGAQRTLRLFAIAGSQRPLAGSVMALNARSATWVKIVTSESD